MAKWGTYPPDEQLRLKREAAGEMYEALEAIVDLLMDDDEVGAFATAKHAGQNALRKARGEAA